MRRVLSAAARALALALVLTTAVGCSRVKLVYGSADLILAHYATDYLGLDSEQLERWEPHLHAAIETHRRDDLPALAGWLDAILNAARQRFPEAETRCLVLDFTTLYKLHAKLAVELAAPLLADMTPDQVVRLQQRFARDDQHDRPRPGDDPKRERLRRARRYVAAIEDWTGPLTRPQRALVADIAWRMPETESAVFAYRTRKREDLIRLIQSKASEASIQGYLNDWLTDYKDLPAELETSRAQLVDRVVELFARLGPTLDPKQQARLERRIRDLRDDLMDLQRTPRMEPVACFAQ